MARGTAPCGATTDRHQRHGPLGFQLLDLIVDAIADAALQQASDVLVQLTVLPPQGGNGDDHRGPDVSQMEGHILGRCPRSASFCAAVHHGEHFTAFKYDLSTFL
jgi:hypothetical protein